MSSPRPLDRVAILLVVGFCAIWALQQVAAKLALPEVGPLTQATIRSAVAGVLVTLYGWRTEPRMFARDGTLLPGVLAGVLFGLEFVALFLGLAATTAGRTTLFLYTAPFFLALGVAFALPNERLSRRQWLGLALSFLGVALALGVAKAGAGASLAGDGLAMAAGAIWAATTLVIKSTALRAAPAVKTLAIQLVVSAPILGLAAALAGETFPTALSGTALAALAYQTLVVACVSYLGWFFLITRYRAGELSAFTFLTPIFGMLTGWLALGERLSADFALAVGLVAAGIAMVNWPDRALRQSSA
ncbi:MAG: DMT family transporter [Rhizobiales bacterium]|nr:DMT family transporter [Hyphomicrobiales bacterium]